MGDEPSDLFFSVRKILTILKLFLVINRNVIAN